MMKIFRSKTMWLAFLVEITGILQLIQLSIDEFRVVIPPEYFGYVLVGIGIAIRVMRLLTTTSLDLKGREYDDSYQSDDIYGRTQFPRAGRRFMF